MSFVQFSFSIIQQQKRQAINNFPLVSVHACMFMSVIMCQYLWVRAVFMQLHKFSVTVSIYVFFHLKCTFCSFEAPTNSRCVKPIRIQHLLPFIGTASGTSSQKWEFCIPIMYNRQVWHTPCKSCLFQILNSTPTAPANWLLIFRSVSLSYSMFTSAHNLKIER